MAISAVILAAGKGSRMKSSLAKVMHKVAGFPMIEHILRTLTNIDNIDEVKIIVTPALESSPKFEQLQEKYRFTVCVQKEQRGTAHALLCTTIPRQEYRDILVLNGDTPLVKSSTLRQLIDAHYKQQSVLSLLGCRYQDPTGYGRFIINENNDLVEIVEESDATEAQRSIDICNTNIMLFSTDALNHALPQIDTENRQGEMYLTDIVKISRKAGYKCTYNITEEERELIGVNTRLQLSQAEHYIQQELRMNAMDNGATLIDPSSTFFSLDTKIASDVTIYPHVFFGKGVEIESNACIMPYSYLEDTYIHSSAQIGPFARLRNGVSIGKGARIGNFVEVKNAELATGVKAAHLSYIGDAEIMDNVNIGAGTIFCNYDGKQKHKSYVSPNAFIGSNSCIISPIKIGAGSMVAAGSVITKDIQEGDLAIARGRQINKTSYFKGNK